MDSSIRSVHVEPAIRGGVVRRTGPRRNPEDEHEFEEEYARHTGGEPRREQPKERAMDLPRPMPLEGEVGSQLDVVA